MASETTFDHWKVVFSWGKMRKSRFSQNPLNSRFWALGFLIYTLSCANFKKDPPWYIFFLSLLVPDTSGHFSKTWPKLVRSLLSPVGQDSIYLSKKSARVIRRSGYISIHGEKGENNPQSTNPFSKTLPFFKFPSIIVTKIKKKCWYQDQSRFWSLHRLRTSG